MKRRSFLTTALAVMATPALAGKAGVTYEVTRSEDEWRAMLTDAEFRVMREEGTERAFTSPLNDESRAGIFHCKGCDQPLYSSETKFESGTGWPRVRLCSAVRCAGLRLCQGVHGEGRRGRACCRPRNVRVSRNRCPRGSGPAI
mgnify:CR=1 FL=1